MCIASLEKGKALADKTISDGEFSIIIHKLKADIRSNNMQRKGHYNPMYNFNYSLNNILGITPFTKLGIDNGEKMLSELRQKIKEYNWHPESLSVEKIWLLLDVINRKDLCKFSTLIHRVITGNPLPFLTFEQKDQITFIYSNVRQYLPRWMNKSFVIYKILDFILPEGPQRKLLSYIRLQSFATNLKNELLWSSAIRKAGIA